MLRNIIISIVAATMGLCAAAQQMRLPAENSHDSYAAIEKYDISRHIPGIEYRELRSMASDDAITTAQDMLSLARTFMGLRYRAGGKTPKGFDCSGFTSYIYSQFGYKLDASSRGQYSNDGETVDRHQVQPGDLIFFTGRAARSGRVGHVGIVIDGDPVTGKITFIHSASSTGISIDNTDAPYYAKRFIGVKRVLK